MFDVPMLHAPQPHGQPPAGALLWSPRLPPKRTCSRVANRTRAQRQPTAERLLRFASGRTAPATNANRPRCHPSPLRFRSASPLRPPSSCGTHRRGSTPYARLPQTPPRRALRPLNHATGVSPDPAEAASASVRPTCTSLHYTSAAPRVTEGYQRFQSSRPQRSPNHHAPLPSPRARIHIWLQILAVSTIHHSMLSVRCSTFPCSPRATVATQSQLGSHCDPRQLPQARGDPGPTAYAHNLALCPTLRRIPSRRFAHLT